MRRAVVGVMAVVMIGCGGGGLPTRTEWHPAGGRTSSLVLTEAQVRAFGRQGYHCTPCHEVRVQDVRGAQ